MLDKLKGKVARILNSRELVINIGSHHGVAKDMVFDVLEPKGENIKDPDTGEVLGSINRPKVSVKIIEVHELMSVATTYRKKRINIGGTSRNAPLSNWTKALLPPKVVMKTQTLKTEEKTWEDLSEEDSYVNIGDPVISVFDIDQLLDLEERSSHSSD